MAAVTVGQRSRRYCSLHRPTASPSSLRRRIRARQAGNRAMKQNQLKDRVRAVMLGNVKEGHSALLGADYCYVMPSRERYQFQWFWDTCFHVFILCALGEFELAKRNVRSLFHQQESNGFVGHM